MNLRAVFTKHMQTMTVLELLQLFLMKIDKNVTFFCKTLYLEHDILQWA